MITEQEAKTKWCHRGTAPGKFEKCIGSACMAFRQHGWRDKEDGQFKSMSYEKADATHWEPMFHCGLAGKP